MMIRIAQLEEETSYPSEKHVWGEFVYSFSGLIELAVGERRYLTPPHYGLWLPPGTEHEAFTRSNTTYCVLDIAADQCGTLPIKVCTLEVSSITKAILADLVNRKRYFPRSDRDERLFQVLMDQMSIAPHQDTYLPTTEDRALKTILSELRKNPGDTRSLSDWAETVNSTEKTLSRRCRQDLGMAFGEWRQRLRLVRAFSLLREGMPVQNVASEMGYRTPSAFIAMFKRMTGSTPEEFRK
jgi:AraC-like DNA-binding protein